MFGQILTVFGTTVLQEQQGNNQGVLRFNIQLTTEKTQGNAFYHNLHQFSYTNK